MYLCKDGRDGVVRFILRSIKMVVIVETKVGAVIGPFPIKRNIFSTIKIFEGSITH